MSPRAHLAIHDPSHRASIRGPIEAPWPLCVPKRSDHDRLMRGFSGFDLVEDTMLELGRRSLLSARARAPGALFGLLLELSLSSRCSRCMRRWSLTRCNLSMHSSRRQSPCNCKLCSSPRPLLVLSSSSTNGSCAIFVTHVNVRLDNGSTETNERRNHPMTLLAKARCSTRGHGCESSYVGRTRPQV